MAQITLKNISKTYPSGIAAVKNLSLSIDDGEFLVLVGPSGCGKSTVLRLIAGLEKADSGQIFIGETEVSSLSPDKRKIAMVFQNYALFPQMSVRDNLAFGLRNLDKTEVSERVRQAAEWLRLSDILDRKPKTLSGGQQQRVALGRALVTKADAFLLDEPLSNLDSKLRSVARGEISTLHQKLGATFVYVTHDQTEAMTMGSRIAVINNGELLQADTPANLYNHPANKFVASFLGREEINFVDGVLSSDGKKIRLFEGSFALTSHRINKEHFGKEVCVGVRPENAFLGKTKGKPCTSARVVLIEELGADALVYALTSKGERLIVRAKTGHNLRISDEIVAGFDTAKLLIFDKETNKNIVQ